MVEPFVDPQFEVFRLRDLLAKARAERDYECNRKLEWQHGCVKAQERADHLQARIDAYVAANAEYGDPQQFFDAKQALLAAATPKEDDRG